MPLSFARVCWPPVERETAMINLQCCLAVNRTCGDVPSGGVRLVGGATELEGRVEVCLDGEWGTICDNFWSNLDATVICHQLSYGKTDASAIQGAYFGAGTGPIFFTDVFCSGDEERVTDCTHSDTTESACTHHQDASVICTGSAFVLYLFVCLFVCWVIAVVFFLLFVVITLFFVCLCCVLCCLLVFCVVYCFFVLFIVCVLFICLLFVCYAYLVVQLCCLWLTCFCCCFLLLFTHLFVCFVVYNYLAISSPRYYLFRWRLEASWRSLSLRGARGDLLQPALRHHL